MHSMSVKINIKKDSGRRMKILRQIPNRINRRLFHRIWILIEAIQILIEAIHPKMPIGHTINVDHRNYHKNKIVSQQLCSCIVSLYRQ